MYAFNARFWPLCFVLALALPLQAQPISDGPPPPRKPLLMERPSLDLQGLDLSEQQRRQIQGIQQEDRKRVQELRQQSEVVQEELRSNFLVEPDEQVLRRFDRVQQLQREVARIRIENLLKIRAVLTPQQKVQLKERMNSRTRPIRTY